MGEMTFWPNFKDMSKILPTKPKKMPGRPRKKRIKASHERGSSSRVSKIGLGMTCQNCYKIGLNKTSCKDAKVVKLKKQPLKKGRPKKTHNPCDGEPNVADGSHTFAVGGLSNVNKADGARAGGAGPATPEITRCTYVTFMKYDPQPFKGTEGTVGLCQRFEKLESVFRISDCKEGISEICNYYSPWSCIDLEEWKDCFHVLMLLNGGAVYSVASKNIRGDVTSSRPTSIDELVRMAYQLMGQIIQDKTNEVSEGEKRK
ncbi:hypothetical protein Tco_0970795 [Tanacetum coccineum]